MGEEILNQVMQKGKSILKQYAKQIARMLFTNPYFYLVLAIILVIIVVAGMHTDVNSGSYSNVRDMILVESSVGSYTIDVYNDDGTVNEEKIQELQLALENTYNLVTGSISGNNIGGEYNKESCEKVTGTYLGFNHWDESGIPRSNLGGIVYQCPWWANGRASEVNGKEIKISGNAKDMYDNGSAYYRTGIQPAPNSIAVYAGGEYGHVAYVEAVDYVNECYYISHAGSGKSWFGIQKMYFNLNGPWSGYQLCGFIYLGLTIDDFF